MGSKVTLPLSSNHSRADTGGLPNQEVFGARYLEARNRSIGEREIFRGTIARTAVTPCQVLRSAILSGAASTSTSTAERHFLAEDSRYPAPN